MCAHTDKDSAVSFSGTTPIHFTKKSYIKEEKVDDEFSLLAV